VDQSWQVVQRVPGERVRQRLSLAIQHVKKISKEEEEHEKALTSDTEAQSGPTLLHWRPREDLRRRKKKKKEKKKVTALTCWALAGQLHDPRGEHEAKEQKSDKQHHRELGDPGERKSGNQ